MSDEFENFPNTAEGDAPHSDLAMDEIEAAYLRAMEATEALLPDDSVNSLREEGEEQPSISNGEAEQEHQNDADEMEREPDEDRQVTPAEVVEGLLFVGSAPIPSKKISEVIGGSTTQVQVDALIEELNTTYASQLRPYEIGLVEGGYRISLKAEFEPIRRRVYGQGPKDVKLNQESLEVLAFIAYQQPTGRDRLDELGKKNIGSTLRQLLRRQLIQLERGEDSKSEKYRTTKRFLDLFGLGSIDDLPQAMDFNFK